MCSSVSVVCTFNMCYHCSTAAVSLNCSVAVCWLHDEIRCTMQGEWTEEVGRFSLIFSVPPFSPPLQKRVSHTRLMKAEVLPPRLAHKGASFSPSAYTLLYMSVRMCSDLHFLCLSSRLTENMRRLSEYATLPQTRKTE